MIEGYEAYWVTENGRVYSGYRQVSPGGHANGFSTVKDDKPFKEMTLTLDRGYYFVGLYKDGKMKKKPVHRIVLEAYLGNSPKPYPHYVACHRNGIPTDNRVENLYWGTPKENSQDMVRMGRQYKGERHWHTRITNEQIREIMAEPRRMGVIPYLSKKYGISKYTVLAIRGGTTRREITNDSSSHNTSPQQVG